MTDQTTKQALEELDAATKKLAASHHDPQESPTTFFRKEMDKLEAMCQKADKGDA